MMISKTVGQICKSPYLGFAHSKFGRKASHCSFSSEGVITSHTAVSDSSYLPLKFKSSIANLDIIIDFGAYLVRTRTTNTLITRPSNSCIGHMPALEELGSPCSRGSPPTTPEDLSQSPVTFSKVVSLFPGADFPFLLFLHLSKDCLLESAYKTAVLGGLEQQRKDSNRESRAVRKANSTDTGFPLGFVLSLKVGGELRGEQS